MFEITNCKVNTGKICSQLRRYACSSLSRKHVEAVDIEVRVIGWKLDAGIIGGESHYFTILFKRTMGTLAWSPQTR